MEKKKEVKSKKTSVKSTSAAKKSTTKKITVKKPVVKKEVVEKEVVEKEAIISVSKVEAKLEKKSNHVLFKALIISIFAAIVLTWIIPSGYFNAGEYVSSEITRTGINEMFLSLFYGANYYLVQLFFLLILGVFYGIIRKTNGYTSMVNKLVEFWKGKEIVFTLINTIIIAVFVSMVTQALPILIFVPLIITIASKLNFSKLNSIAMTFGAMMVGLAGTTFSTYGLSYINSYMNTTVTTGIWFRAGILVIGLLLLNILILLSSKKKSQSEVITDDLFEADGVKELGKASPYLILFGLLFVVIVLGYIPWSESFGVTIFDTLNTNVTTEIKIAGHPIFGYILGKVTAFGAWDLFTTCTIMMISLILVKICSRVKFDDALDYAIDGLKKMAKPAILVVFAYSMFVICYWSGFTTWIINFLNSGDSFNPFLNALGNGIATFFHVDFGYSGYSLAAFYATKFADFTPTIMAIMTSMNGLVSFVAPTSVFLLVGCSMYDVSYKNWMKYIWKFVVGFLVMLLIIFTLMTYL